MITYYIHFKQFPSDCRRECVITAKSEQDAEDMLKSWHPQGFVLMIIETEHITGYCKDGTTGDT